MRHVRDIPEHGRELGVRYVLEGSVRNSGSRLRITGQLIASTTNLWADHFDGALKDIFELQDKVTEAVVGAIEAKLQQAEVERAKRKLTESLDAYDYYLRAVANYCPSTMDEAKQLLRMLPPSISIPALRRHMGWQHGVILGTRALD
jgi:hypothetical protein